MKQTNLAVCQNIPDFTLDIYSAVRSLLRLLKGMSAVDGKYDIGTAIK